jgi:hypothetical protein
VPGTGRRDAETFAVPSVSDAKREIAAVDALSGMMSHRPRTARLKCVQIVGGREILTVGGVLLMG